MLLDIIYCCLPGERDDSPGGVCARSTARSTLQSFAERSPGTDLVLPHWSGSAGGCCWTTCDLLLETLVLELQSCRQQLRAGKV